MRARVSSSPSSIKVRDELRLEVDHAQDVRAAPLPAAQSPPQEAKGAGQAVLVLGGDASEITRRAHHHQRRRQIDLRIGMLSCLELTRSAGYAAAFEKARPTKHEGMLSLKILR